MQGLYSVLGPNDIMAYLSMMAIRLIELHRVLKPTGTMYLHCDPSASHYLKILLDSLFGSKNYRNEIVWCYAGGGIPKKDFPRKHDVLLRYTKTDNYFYQPIYRPYTKGTLQRGRTKVKGKYAEQGLRKEGTPVNDWWIDVPKITSPSDPEKLGYPTQKPVSLLQRIISSSSQEGDLVLDPFCGCGTTIDASELLHRRWIGIDITHLAINLMASRLKQNYGNQHSSYEVLGEPKDIHSAEALAQTDRYQFQWWALSKVFARSSNDNKRGSDKGIDGYIYFCDDSAGKAKKVIVQVKSGTVNVSHLRDLRGVIESEGAAIGVLLTLKGPTKLMQDYTFSAGYYESRFGQFPKLQILTIADLLDGKRIEFPQIYPRFRKASKSNLDKPDQLRLF